MANQETTNRHFNVGSDSTFATLITLSPTAKWVQIQITGTTGGARVAKNTTTPNLLTDNSLPVNIPVLIGAEPGSGGISTLLVYSNASETGMTGDIVVNVAGQSVTS